MHLTRTELVPRKPSLKCVQLRKFPKRMTQVYQRDQYCSSRGGVRCITYCEEEDT